MFIRRADEKHSMDGIQFVGCTEIMYPISTTIVRRGRYKVSLMTTAGGLNECWTRLGLMYDRGSGPPLVGTVTLGSESTENADRAGRHYGSVS